MAKSKFNSAKLLKTLTSSKGSMLPPHIDRYLAAGKFPRQWVVTINNFREKDDYFHPSGDCYAEPIDLWRVRKGVAPSYPITASLRRTFDVGHMWHGYLQNILVDMGFVTPENVERTLLHKIVTPEGNCIGKGTADLVDVEIPGYGSWLVDIKTMNKEEFVKGANTYTLQKWTAQVNCYMDWLDTEKAFILAVCKDSPHAFREYQIQRDQNLLDSIYERWVYTQNMLDANVLPEKGFDIPDILKNPGDSVLDVIEANKLAEPSV
jgi:hypothetical protein